MQEHPVTEPSPDDVSADGAPPDDGATKKKTSSRSKKRSKPTPPPAPPGGEKSATGPPPKSRKRGKQREAVGVEEGEPVERPLSITRVMPGWMVSMVAHMLLILIMAIWEMAAPAGGGLSVLNSVNRPDETDDLEEMKVEPEEDLPKDTELPSLPQMQISKVDPVAAQVRNVDVDERVGTQQVKVKVNFSEKIAPKNSIIKKIGAFGKGLAGRNSGTRRALLRRYGGTEKSEQAVAAALRWLANHQRRDGGWSFNHRTPQCGRFCTHPGSMATSRNGATALALLPFLGAGQTHKQGKYKEVVGRGLLFLARRMKTKNFMGSLVDKGGGMMYSHGLAAIALCEAYAMTKDRELMQLAQLSLNFTMYAQDPVGGGWRYIPRERGDTSAVGWQLMALKSGHMADLQVNPLAFKKAWFFLNTVSRNGGSEYGYMSPQSGGPGTTAVGLLSRMYLGWQKENPILQQGVTYLSNVGPTRNMYYNYYATQVMRHYEGPLWDKWNKVNREALIKLQDKNGHAHGSWDCAANGDHGSKSGGRLYCTAFAAMILEVYYRHMPLYGKKASDDDFKF